ncbi:MAG: hypothetical protein IPJ41_14850 [Phycisphaerales bacterium]|nr:hypothetical protein [Phycisphaerales bacterium]
MVMQVTPDPLPSGAQACVWMQAGLLAYRLCPLHLDCEHCPLDAALRAGAPSPATADQPHTPSPPQFQRFPDDRRYTPRHTWLRPDTPGAQHGRFGLDALAAALVGLPLRIEHPPDAAACVLILREGGIPVLAPHEFRFTRWNHALDTDPGLLLTDPYGDGWLAELAAMPTDRKRTEHDQPAPDAFLDAPEAASRARLDLRRFRRRIALAMLDDAASLDQPRPPDRLAGATTDVRTLLSPRQFVEAIRDLLHAPCAAPCNSSVANFISP